MHPLSLKLMFNVVTNIWRVRCYRNSFESIVIVRDATISNISDVISSEGRKLQLKKFF